MSMAGDSGMMSAAQLRVQIIGDPTNIQHSLDSIVGATERTAGKMSSLFRDVGGVLTSAFAIGGGIALLGKGIDLASQQQSLQSVQATLLKNQNETQQSFIGGLQTVVGTQTAVNKNGEQYSKLLDKQATDLSFQTGIQKNQIIQAQNLLLPNTDLTSLYASQTQYSKTTGGYLNAAVEASANLAAQMGSGGSGIVGASRMISRLLADPARSMGSMSRMGFHLSLAQQVQIKNVQKQNGLLAAQQLILQDINGSLRGTAEAAISPVERMQNDIMLIMQQMGRGLMPIIDNLAAVVSQTLYVLDPIFNTVAQAIGAMSGTIGNTLGSISKIIEPLAKVFTEGVLPAILAVIQPIAEFIGVIGTQLNNIFNSTAVQTFIGLFASFGNTLGDAITPALKEISDVFTEMTSNGQLTALWTSFYQIFAALMPILPTLATAFANILNAMLPMMPALVTIVTAMAKFAAFSLTKLVNAFDYLVKKISEFKPLFEIIMGALIALSVVFFAKHLFITPIQAFLEMMGKATRASLVFGETTKGAVSGAFKGFRERGLLGILTGGQAGKAQAEYMQRQRDIIQALRLKQINPREALRAERENQIEGALAQEKYKNLRRSSMPLFGRAFMRKQMEGESDEAYAEYKRQQKSQRGLRAYLQGPTMDVGSYIKMMKLDEGDELEKSEAEKAIEGTQKNTKALGYLTATLKSTGNYFVKGLKDSQNATMQAMGATEKNTGTTASASAQNTSNDAKVSGAISSAVTSSASNIKAYQSAYQSTTQGFVSSISQVKGAINLDAQEMKIAAEEVALSNRSGGGGAGGGNGLSGKGKFGKDLTEAEKLAQEAENAKNLEGVAGDVGKAGGLLSRFGKAGGLLSRFSGIGSKLGGFGKLGGLVGAGEEGGSLLSGLAGGSGILGSLGGLVGGGGGMLGDAALAGSVGLDAIPGLGEVAMAAQAAILLKQHWRGLLTGAKAVGRFAGGAATHIGHGLEDVNKVVGKVAGGIGHDIGSFFGGLFGGGGHRTVAKMAAAGGLGALSKVALTGNAMNVHILSASASAGKALNGTGRSNQPSTNVSVQPGAFVVNVQGNMDSASMADVKNHVNEQFRQLRYSLKAQGR
jgi:hypothetical protein